MKEVEMFCKNTGTNHSFPLGTSLLEISEALQIKTKNKVCGAIVNNQVRELSFCLVKPKQIEFFDITHRDGHRLYIRSLFFLLYAAVKETFPEVTLHIQNGISNGYFFEINGLDHKLTESDIYTIAQEMKWLVSRDIPFIKKRMLTTDAAELLRNQGLKDKALLFEQQGMLYSSLYFLEELGDFYYGHLLPSTGYITNFGLIPYYDGLLLQMPKQKKIEKLQKVTERKKLFGIFQEQKEWAEILNVSTIGKLNRFTLKQRGGDVIKVSEALHEKKIAEIANMIFEKRDEIKIVLVSGPSASGKTTFSKRLGIQLIVNGLIPHQISLDDYFVDREHTPVDEFGEYDFESLEAIDIDYFNQQLCELLEGKEIEIPGFDFQTGRRKTTGRKLRLRPNDILVVEGIHGMNPDLLPHIDRRFTFSIFISALTQIAYDEHTNISTADNRLLRRIIRDSQYRGYPAWETIKRWPSVRRGEEKNIFPHQENADIMFNSATLYELAVLKKYAEPLLKNVEENRTEYIEASRLLKFLSWFKQIDDYEIPPTSLLREFLGGSSFIY